MQSILQVSHLTKIFRSNGVDFTAVDGISFDVKEGEIVGLLGPNGAGKTTTIQMLLGLLIPTSGSISYFGKDFPKEREYILSRINYASAYAQIQGKMSVRQSLRIYAGLYGVDHADARIDELLELLEVRHAADTLFWHLSSGQKTRVILAKALLNKPKLILMDEPTASLDPEIVDKVLGLIERLRASEKISLLFASHHMDEVERICDRVIFLSGGRIVAQDTPLGLTKRVGSVRLMITFDGRSEPVASYLTSHAFTHTFVRKHVVVIELPEKEVPKALFGLSKQRVWMTNIEIKKPDLEDVFLSIAHAARA